MLVLMASDADARGKGSVHPISRMYGGCTARYCICNSKHNETTGHVIVQIPQRRRTDVRRIYASDIARISCGYRADIVQIWGFRTDIARIWYGFPLKDLEGRDVVRISYGCSTDIVRI